MVNIKECGWDADSAKHIRRFKYTVVRTLGEGGQGKTEIVRRQDDNKVFVRKIQKRYNMHGSIPEEMHILESILSPHPSIVAFDHSNFIVEDRALVLYFEHCEGGDLSDYIGNRKKVSEDFIWSCFTQLADALAFLHYGYDRKAKDPYAAPTRWQAIIHRDVKPANVFLRYKITTRNPMPDVVLGDFGLATMRTATADCGTDAWIGPEFGSNNITAKSDVWGVGAIIHALAHGEGPVSSRPKDWPKAIESAWYTSPLARKPKPMSSFYSKNLNDNMMDCLSKEPAKRVSSDRLVRHLQEDKPRKK